MNIGTIIEIIIGLVFIYLILGLLVSEFQEAWGSYREYRAKHLKNAIRIFLDEDKLDYGSNSEVWIDLANNQPFNGEIKNPDNLKEGWILETDNNQLIESNNSNIFKNESEAEAIKKKQELQEDNKVFEIKHIQFQKQIIITKLLYQSLQLASINQYSDTNTNRYQNNKFLEIIESIKSINKKKPFIKNNPSEGFSYIDSEFFAYALIGVINKEISDELKKIKRSSEATDLKNAINSLNYTPAKDKLIAIIDDLTLKSDEPKLENFIDEIKKQFDLAMIRSSGVYKRNAKGVSLLIGLIIAIGGNVDTFYIVNTLYNNNTLRSNIVDQVSENSEKLNPQQIDICLNKEQKEADECLNEFKTNINNTVEKITPLPIGWNIHFLKNLSLQKILLAIIWLPIKLLGWCISAIAISMGAPFWFDLLGKVMNVRNTGRSSSPQPNTSSSNSG